MGYHGLYTAVDDALKSSGLLYQTPDATPCGAAYCLNHCQVKQGTDHYGTIHLKHRLVIACVHCHTRSDLCSCPFTDPALSVCHQGGCKLYTVHYRIGRQYQTSGEVEHMQLAGFAKFLIPRISYINDYGCATATAKHSADLFRLLLDTFWLGRALRRPKLIFDSWISGRLKRGIASAAARLAIHSIPWRIKQLFPVLYQETRPGCCVLN